MVLYYALGGGLGHLTRARRVLSALGLEDRAVLLTASRFARDPRVTGGLPVVWVPVRLGHDRAAFRSWLGDALAALGPHELIVDSFPAGILGELCGMQLPPARYVARRLRWPAYARRLAGSPPRFELAHVLEPLAERHALWLAARARRVEALEPPAWLASAGGRRGASAPLIDERHWLVVHSGPDAEVVALAEHAAELRSASPGAAARMLVVSPQRPSSLPLRAQWRDVYPVTPYLAHAEQIVTAAGFNVIHETASVRELHRFVPFPRALDDQFARAAGARRSAAIRPAATAEK